MPILFSKKTNGFYETGINGKNIPVDAVEITSKYHFDLLSGQSSGKNIASNDEGYPFLVDPDPVAFVPSVVTRFQALAALHLAGVFDSVESSIESADFMTKLAWKEAQSFERDSAMIASIGAAVGLTDEDIDNLFISASKIK